jgi:WD40 repeat protein
MFLYLRPIFKIVLVSIVLFKSCSLANAQQKNVQLSIQQGHSDDITFIAVSSDFKYFASYGKDRRVVIWDYKTGSQMAFSYLNKDLIGFTFEHQSNKLILITSSLAILTLDIRSMKIESINSTQSNYLTDKTKAFFDNKEVSIKDAKISLINVQTKKVETSKTADYFDQPFNVVKYCAKTNKIYVGCEDGYIYIFDSQLKLLKQLKNHNSGVNDLAFTSDFQYMFSVSSDRSIIKWNLITEKMESRFTGKNFPIYGVSLNNSGTEMLFGDEIGYRKLIKLNNSRLEISSQRKFLYPLTYTFQFKDSTTLVAGNDNVLHIEKNNTTQEKYRNISISPKSFTHHLFTKKLDFYQPPYSFYTSIDVNPSETFVAISNEIKAKRPKYIQILSLNNRKNSPKLYIKNHPEITLIFFLNDSTLIAGIPNKKDVTVWRINNQNINKIYQKTIELPFVADNFVRFNNEWMVASNSSKLYFYNFYTQEIIEKPIANINHLFSISDNKISFTTIQNQLFIIRKNNANFQIGEAFIGHEDQITSVSQSSERNLLFTSSLDGTIRVWNETKNELIITMIPIGYEQCMYITPDNYYMTTNKGLGSFGFKMNEEFFFPEQFDPFYNRPDIILDRLGYADSTLVKAYHQAYLKRLKKMNFTEDMLQDDFHLPELKIENFEKMPTIIEGDELDLNLNIKDSKYPLDRINVWINDVAVYGTNGISIRDKSTQEYTTSLKLKLAQGNNKIQISVLNQAGAESYKETFTVDCKAGKEKPNLYVVAIGVSTFEQSQYNLKFAAKDAEDMAKVYANNKNYGQVFTKSLTNQEVTKENIEQLREFLKAADRNDEVILFFAGHGVLDAQLDYYLASYDMDFSNPADRGIAYESLERLLDGIAPLKKILLIDACHSGEIDKDEVAINTATVVEEGGVKFRNVGNTIANKESHLGLQNISELTKSLFADLRKGTGATVISSAGGMEFAMESSQWQNGLFTYCYINGLQSKAADLNKDGVIMLSELQQYVATQVTKLSNGKQQPTSRIENNVLDWRVW